MKRLFALLIVVLFVAACSQTITIPQIGGTWQDPSAVLSGCGNTAAASVQLQIGNIITSTNGTSQVSGVFSLSDSSGAISGNFNGSFSNNRLSGTASASSGSFAVNLSLAGGAFSGAFTFNSSIACGDGSLSVPKVYVSLTR